MGSPASIPVLPQAFYRSNCTNKVDFFEELGPQVGVCAADPLMNPRAEGPSFPEVSSTKGMINAGASGRGSLTIVV